MSSPTVTLERAIFGEVNGAHAARASTFNSPHLATLAMRLDLPDQPPAGATWKPYLAGFPFQDRYIFAYVRSDPAARRSGMVVSHALIARASDLGQLNRLDMLAEELRSGEAGAPLQKLTITPQSDTYLKVGPLSVGLANLLAERSTAPAVLLQQDGAEDALFLAWQHLPGSVRANFGFRLSFAQKDLVETPAPAVVFVPESLQSRWSHERVVKAEEQFRTSLAGILCGSASSAPLMEFLSKVDCTPASIGDLVLTQLALQHLASNDFADTLATIRLVERISPDSEAGSEEKERLLTQLVEQLPGQPFETALHLRNLTKQGFRSLDAVWNGLQRRLSEMSFSPQNDGTLATLLGAASDKDVEGSRWLQAVTGGLTQAVKKAPDQFSEALWRFSGGPDGLAILGALKSTLWNVDRISRRIPANVKKQAAETLEVFARRRGLNTLLAAALRVRYSLVDALARYESADPALSNANALDILLRAVTGTEIATLLEQRADNSLLLSAARALAGQPARFRGVNFRLANMQRLWAAALNISSSAWSASFDLENVVGDLFKTLAAGGSVDPELLVHLSKSDHANLSGFSDRAKIWARVPPSVVNAFLEGTSTAWLRALEKSIILFAPDDQLEKYILQRNDLAASLAQLLKRGQAEEFSASIKALPGLSENMFLAVLGNLTSTDARLGHAEAASVGRLVAEREWSSGALKLKELYERGRTDLKPALETCQVLLPSWTRYSLGLAAPNPEESWEMLRDVAVSLYSYGPDQDHLWMRAGGKNSELPTDGNGSAKWFEAVQKMRNGGSVKVDRLLREMRKDYPNNARLDFLSRLPLFRSSGGTYWLFGGWGDK